MAESVVAQPAQRFYCHKCNVEIENVNTTVSKLQSVDWIECKKKLQ